MKSWNCTNHVLQKILTSTIRLLAPAANMPSTSHFPIESMIWQHADFFGLDLRNQFEHGFPSRPMDGTPHSSCDLLSSSHFLVTLFLDEYSTSNFRHCFLWWIILCPILSTLLSLIGQIFPSPTFNSLEIFYD